MADEKQAKKPFERLPTNVLPRNYKLELKPDLKKFTFEGQLEITAEVSQPAWAGPGESVLQLAEDQCCC